MVSYFKQSFSGPVPNLSDVFSAMQSQYNAVASVLTTNLPSLLALKNVPGLPPQLAGAIGTLQQLWNLVQEYNASLNTISAMADTVLAQQSRYNKALDNYLALVNALNAANAACPPPPPVPNPSDPPNPDDGPSANVNNAHSVDPNDMTTTGYGSQGFIQSSAPITYTIDFENEPTAGAAAQTVTITDQLNADLDWSTVQLTGVAFNGVQLTPPSGANQYETTTTVATDPTHPVKVDVQFDAATGTLTWTMQSVDPISGLPTTDPLAGFLPPDNAQQQGEGSVTFTAAPIHSLATGTVIPNQATVVFDTNAPISTPQVVNTIDDTAPTATVNSLPVFTRSSFHVSWTGSDGAGGSGVATYDLFVSDNGGAFAPVLTGTTATSTTFNGQLGHTYGFYVIASDNAGNRGAAPAAAQATTDSIVTDANGAFVVAAFSDVLGRSVDQGSLTYWTNQLDQGVSRVTVANLITHSAEYFGLVIQQAYQRFMGREADAAGLAYWTAQMQAGLADEELEAGFIGSEEYYLHSGGTDAKWVAGMYQDLLGRAADAQGLSYWVEVLALGESRAEVAYGFAASLEREQARVEADYTHYLGRVADSGGVAYWVNQFAHGVTNEDLITGFVASDEYFAGHTT